MHIVIGIELACPVYSATFRSPQPRKILEPSTPDKSYPDSSVARAPELVASDSQLCGHPPMGFRKGCVRVSSCEDLLSSYFKPHLRPYAGWTSASFSEMLGTT